MRKHYKAGDIIETSSEERMKQGCPLCGCENHNISIYDCGFSGEYLGNLSPLIRENEYMHRLRIITMCQRYRPYLLASELLEKIWLSTKAL